MPAHFSENRVYSHESVDNSVNDIFLGVRDLIYRE